MSSPLDPIWSPPRVEPVSPSVRIKRRRDAKDDKGGAQPDESKDDREQDPDDDGIHIDVLA